MRQPGEKVRVAVLASGVGTNLAALLCDAEAPAAPYSIALVLGNRPGAGALDKGRAAGVPTVVVERALWSSRAAQQGEMLRLLQDHEIDLVVLAGFDQILVLDIVDAFPDRIVNVHPSLLPAFAGGLHAIAEALAYGVKVTGCTVHLVTAELDAGPIILQETTPVRDDDTIETLSARIHALEHLILPRAVRLLVTHRVQVEGRRILLSDALPLDASIQQR